MFVSLFFGFAHPSSRLSEIEWILGCTGAFLQLSFGNFHYCWWKFSSLFFLDKIWEGHHSKSWPGLKW
jgi:hypothetical protein